MSAPFEQFFSQIAHEQVEVVVIGGLAAVALGVAYVTQDIDLCYNPEPSNVERLARALAPFHPRLRVEGLLDEDARRLPFRLDAQTLRQSAILTLQTDVTELDVMSSVPGVGDFAQVRAAAIELPLFGASLLVLDLPALIASKRAAGRAKDLQLLPQLEATLRLREQGQQGS